MHVLAEVVTGGKVTHVLEDDAVLSSQLDGAINAAINGRLLDQFDIVLLDFTMPYDPRLLARYKQLADPHRISVINLAGCKFWGTASYVVSPRGAAKLVDVCGRAWAQKPAALDNVLCEQARAGALRAAAIFPFVTIVHLQDLLASTIEKSATR